VRLHDRKNKRGHDQGQAPTASPISEM
jgi:hypothetical protein